MVKGVEKNYILELTVDIIHVVNMFLLFITAVKTDTKLKTNFSEIAFYNLKNFMFYIDIVATFPTLLTLYNYPSLYYFKLLRLHEFMLV